MEMRVTGTEQVQPAEFDISVHALAEMRNTDAAHTILDIRRPDELAVCMIPGSVTIPMQQVMDEFELLSRERKLILVCHHGMRSGLVTEFLRNNGFDNVWNLAGGIDAWSEQIDPAMPRY